MTVLIRKSNNIIKSPDVDLTAVNFIIGSNIPQSEKVYVKENKQNNSDVFEIDESKNLKNKLIDLEKQIKEKQEHLNRIEQESINKINSERDKIIQNANLEKQKIISDARTMIELEKKEGYQKGFEEGYKVSINEFKKETSKSFEILDAVITEIKKNNEKTLFDFKQELLEIIKVFSMKIVNREIENFSEDILINNLTEVLQELSEPSNITIKVNPENAEKIKQLKNLITQNLESVEKIRIIGTQNIDITGCVIETDNGIFESTLKNRFKEIYKQLETIFQIPKK